MMPPLKVLYMLHDSRRSGVPAVMASLIRSLDRSQVEPSALFAYDGIYAQELRGESLDVWTMGKRSPLIWRFKRFLMNVRLLLLAKRFDIVHVNSVKLALSVLVARCLGAKVVFHLHEKVGRFGCLLVRAMAMADCVVFCAANCADHYSAVPARRKRTILNAVRVPENVSPPSVARQKIVMFGSINKNKGQDLLLKAFSLIGDRDAELYFYGTVGLSAHGFVWSLKKYVAENGLSSRVFFPGPTTEAQKVFREATVLVHSSLNECMSISILEAMSYGVPVIANDITGMDEIIKDGVNGFLVKPGDVKALADRINRVLDDPGLRAAVGAAERSTVREQFDMTRRAEDFVSLYRELA